MSKISVVVVLAGAALPSGVTRASVNVVVTDANGPQSPVVLTGSESPPYTFEATVGSDLVGSITASDVDAKGNVIGTPVTQSYDLATGGGGTPPSQQLATSGLTVSLVSA